MTKVREGDEVRIEDDRVFVGDDLVGVGIRQTEDSVREAMDDARSASRSSSRAFASNTMEYMIRERDLLFGGRGLPELDHSLVGRHALVVVRGTGTARTSPRSERTSVRSSPVLIGVDGGADALLEAGYRPDIILGDMDSVSERALRAAPRSSLHAYPNGFAPGKERLTALGLPFNVLKASGTSEDVAFILAHGKGAELIVAVGSHGNLREFLDKGRMGMASTFLVRLRVGEILVDAKGVSRLYRGRLRARDAWLLVGGGAAGDRGGHRRLAAAPARTCGSCTSRCGSSCFRLTT